MNKIILLILLLVIMLANIDFSAQAENKIIPVPTYNDYLVANKQVSIETENPYFMTRTEKINLIYLVALEERVDFWELKTEVNRKIKL